MSVRLCLDGHIIHACRLWRSLLQWRRTQPQCSRRCSPQVSCMLVPLPESNPLCCKVASHVHPFSFMHTGLVALAALFTHSWRAGNALNAIQEWTRQLEGSSADPDKITIVAPRTI